MKTDKKPTFDLKNNLTLIYINFLNKFQYDLVLLLFEIFLNQRIFLKIKNAILWHQS